MPDGVEERENIITKVINKSADKILGRRGTKKEQQISEKTWKTIDQRKIAKANKESAITETQRQHAEKHYRKLDKEVKKLCKKDKNKWVENRIGEAQQAALHNDSRTTYKIIRELTGTKSSSNIPIKDKNGKHC